MFLIAIPIIFYLALLFFMISAIIYVPFYVIRGAVRGARRIASRPEPTSRLRGRLEEIVDPFPTTETFKTDFESKFIAACGGRVPLPAILSCLVTTATCLYQDQGLDPLAPPSPSGIDPITRARYRDEIIAGLKTAGEAPRILATIQRAFLAAFAELARKLPASSLAARDAASPSAEPLFTIALADMVRNPGQAVADMIRPFHEPSVESFKLFRALREQLNRNLYEASGQRSPAPEHKLVHPCDHPGSPKEIVKAYLGYMLITSDAAH